ncbi:MAG: geranylgeranyl pyrophosphate synthetase [Planctomycetota bacterium]|nr:MAG: geranylgeranyl pyrophosphate synthetase [Planctomycetota bacterium]
MSEPIESLQATWSAWKSLVESALAKCLTEGGGLGEECPDRLREAMSYSLLAGGKRLRPVLVLMACEACGGDSAAALPAACAIEMIHTYSLIHDDLPAMDNDDYRRGRLTNHKVFGDGLAILAGDALLTLAFEVMARDVRPAAVAAACCADLAFAAGACGMVGGQVADLEAESLTRSASEGVPAELDGTFGWPSLALRVNENDPLAHLQSIHRRKTGRLIRSALTLGGRIAQADVATLGTLDHYGTCIGLAFQIADDVLDVTGSQDKLGKGVGKDAGLGKLTYPGLIGLDRSRQMAQELIDEACAAIAAWGERGQRLQAMARFVLERDH